MSDISDLRFTTIPKSDQLNADQLIGGPMTITVTAVRLNDSAQQPVIVNYQGDGGRPFKPCLTMRRILTHEAAWGPDGRAWVGKSMTLYTDPAVKFGNDTTGGVRISHLSDIKKPLEVRLSQSKGKRALYRVDPLDDGHARLLAGIRAAADMDALQAAFEAAWKTTKDTARRADYTAEKDRRKMELAPSALLQEYVAKVSAAPNSDEAGVLLDEARSTLKPAELAELNKAFADRFGGA